jgi:hypothetical protein
MSRGSPAREAGPRPLFDGEITVTLDDTTRPLSLRLVLDTSLRITLTDDADLFFLYEGEYDADSYVTLKESQGLSLDFEEFCVALAEIIKETSPKSGYRLRLELGDDPELAVLQQLKIKTVTVVALKIEPASDETVRKWIHSRYQAVKEELGSVLEERQTLFAMLKIKDPSILKQSKTTRK